MSHPRYPKTCEWCGREWEASKRQSRTCSPKCRAFLREVETPSPGQKREYPDDVVHLATSLYRGGATVVEVQAALPAGYKAQLILERHMPKRRIAAKRHQSGPANHAWAGDEAGYGAAHWRVKSLNGPARKHQCIDCGSTARDWSYIGGAPDEQISSDNGCAYSLTPTYYVPRCVKCHRAYDRRRGDAS